ncbi:bacteriorhodopsin [Lecanosticta acicola]|uniref:Bacteriorhodopsin n=1 Tax=Lecanosticta acicola TaxID=111012 RepID=A0AAI8Z8P8_9PEZI|nr:bacteriorhodopsin [Lecanosticta acicola]
MADSLFKRVNNAVYNNPPTANGRTADIHITEHGSDYYFALCAFFGFMGIVFMGSSLTKRRTDRVFFYIAAGINFIASISYYTMGSNLGMTPIAVEFQHPCSTGPRVCGNEREVFWVRYVDWYSPMAITTPMILLEVLLTSGMPAPTILFAMFMDEIMIIMGLVGAVTVTGYKWGFFAFGCAAMFFVFWILIWQGRKYAQHLGSDIHKAYILPVVWLLIVWFCYPVCWGVSEGGNVIAPDSEAVYYGILDLLAKPFFSILTLSLHRKIDPARMGLKFRDYDEDFFHGHWRPERDSHVPQIPRDPEKEEPPAGDGVRGGGSGDAQPAAAAANGQDTAAPPAPPPASSE